MKRPLVLLVDDDMEYRRTLEEVLEEEGYLVKGVGDGNEGLAAVERLGDRVGVIVADIEMPGMHGLTFVEKLTAMNNDVPILMASTRGGLKDDFALRSNPRVKDFLVKPFDLEALLKTLPTVMDIDRPLPDLKLVLVAEEVAADLRNIEQFLERQGYIVKAAHDRYEALETARRIGSEIDLYVLAFEMLAGNHATRIEFLRSFIQEVRAEKPIALMFARDEFAAFAEENLKTQVKEHLMKPFTNEALLELARKYA
ncbi:response regulator [bacterium]|nr:response regulator [bacterium]